jgi:hypothetical protein
MYQYIHANHVYEEINTFVLTRFIFKILQQHRPYREWPQYNFFLFPDSSYIRHAQFLKGLITFSPSFFFIQMKIPVNVSVKRIKLNLLLEIFFFSSKIRIDVINSKGNPEWWVTTWFCGLNFVHLRYFCLLWPMTNYIKGLLSTFTQVYNPQKK